MKFATATRQDQSSQQSKKQASSRKRSGKNAFSFVGRAAFMVLFVAASAANAYAFYEALNHPLLEKLTPVLTLGGILVLGPIEWLMRLVMGAALLWLCITHRGKRNWVDWLGIFLLAIATVAGWGAIVMNFALVVALGVWFIFQYVQFLSIEFDSPALRSLAVVLYLVELIFQCVSNPISADTPLQLVNSFFAGTLTLTQIYWGILLVNVACMFGVEWLSRLYKECLKAGAKVYA